MAFAIALYLLRTPVTQLPCQVRLLFFGAFVFCLCFTVASYAPFLYSCILRCSSPALCSILFTFYLAIQLRVFCLSALRTFGFLAFRISRFPFVIFTRNRCVKSGYLARRCTNDQNTRPADVQDPPSVGPSNSADAGVGADSNDNQDPPAKGASVSEPDLDRVVLFCC